MIGIEELVCFVPERRVAIADLKSELQLSDEDIFVHTTFLGQSKVAYDPQLPLIKLLQGALDQLVVSPAYTGYKITHLLYTHTVGCNQAPLQPLLNELVQQYGLSECNAMAITQGSCAAGIMALKYAENLLHEANDDEAIIILSGDRSFGNWRKQPGTAITGDAASAALITRNGTKSKVLNTHMKIDSRFHMGFGDPKVLEEFRKDSLDLLKQFVVDSIGKSGYELADLTLILPPITNKSSWKTVANHLGINKSMIYVDNVPKIGHCFTADNFINYCTARDEGKIKKGDLCLLLSTGTGFFYTSALIRH
ncbi:MULTISPECIES: ketoacyl-ACP synthase III family protein [Rheinheimera]|uniref:Ketoacyl-ACP synthase III family protein n=1 Tax=Rheinheimera maricola TaxID=2793282 RepID=A0ABS7XD99_9GAMM|nr:MULTISPECIES: ketoacyl-ACP synthase III family protein [Rheinheimera]MBZ9613139.1 ketoacyl-ACP synthase III family protein [Rheinheimera maricola]